MQEASAEHVNKMRALQQEQAYSKINCMKKDLPGTNNVQGI
jgi:hypothetical protein